MTTLENFVRLCWAQLRLARSSRSEVFGVFVEPAVYAVLVGVLFRFADRDRATVAVWGAGMMGAWTSILYAAAASLQLSRQQAMLEPLIATRTSLSRITAATSVSAAVLGTVSMTTTGMIGATLLGLPMIPADPATFLAGTVLFLAGLVAMGMLLAPLFVIYPHATALANSSDYPAYILGGLIVPVALLPEWLRPLSYPFAPAWGVRMMQAAAVGGPPDHWRWAGAAIIVSLATGGAGFLLMRRLESAALRRGNLGMV